MNTVTVDINAGSGSSTDAMSTRQAANHLGCSEGSLRLWRHQKRGPRYFRVGKLVRYRRADLELWIEANSVSPSSEKGQFAAGRSSRAEAND